MIHSGAQIMGKSLVRGVRHTAQQQQPCGIDLTLKTISQWTSNATLDFDNTKREAAQRSEIPFDAQDRITLHPGAYLVDFNETVKVPCDCMATMFPRSSLWRSGVIISSGIIDAGYQGALGALLEVVNPHGLVLYRDAKVSQIIFEMMSETVPGYNGVYQHSQSSAGLDGKAESRPAVGANTL
jgi:dUTP pyrophosphatase